MAPHPGIRSSGRGFTLVETAVVVVIVAVLAAVAIPSFAGASARSRVDAAAARIVQDIGVASATAAASSSPRMIIFSAAQDAYVLAGVKSGSSSLHRQVDLGGPPYNTNIVSASFESAAFLTLNGFGVAGSGGVIDIAVGTNARRIRLTGGSSALEVRSMELTRKADTDVLPSIRRVLSAVTVDVMSAEAAALRTAR
ncbi:MAG: prepilin-type N-terminal cleavage/methylation domain-containing protein [Planctomycetota bacterium]